MDFQLKPGIYRTAARCLSWGALLAVVWTAPAVLAQTIPNQDLKLWLKADAGLILNGNSVSQWTDQSGSGTNATQTQAGNQPVVVPGVLNGKPVIRFNGSSQFMSFKLPVNGLTAMTLILVTASAQNPSAGPYGVENAPIFWNETASWGTLHVSPFQTAVKYRFGTGQVGNLPVYTRPASISNGFTLTTAIKSGTSESLFVNGDQVMTQTGKWSAISNVSDTGNLGRGYNDNTYYAGDIAEVIIYTRALSDTERQQVEQYLKSKYFVSAPTTSPITTQTSIPTQNLKLWLHADTGVAANSGLVSQWTDQSGAGTNAVQTNPGNQPSLVPNVINGKPVVRFNGTSSYLTFNLPVNGLNGLTIILVSSSAQDMDGGRYGVANAPIFWNETNSWGTLHLSPFQRVVRYRFGTGQTDNLPAYTRPVSVGSQVTLATAIKNGTSESLFLDGSLVMSQNGKWANIANVNDIGNLGRGYNDDTYFAGDIAEVLVYTRALSDAERQQVEQYLAAKYLGSAPVVTTSNQPPTVSAGPSLTVTLPSAASLNGTATDDGLPNGTLNTTWSKASGPGTVAFASASALDTTATFSAAGTYTLRLTASDGALSAYSDTSVTVNSSTTTSGSTTGGSSGTSTSTVGPVAGGSPPAGAIILSPGADIQSAVNTHAAGSVYYLKAGVYRMQSITPHNGDTFIGALGAILNGSKIITSFTQSGSYWVASGQLPQGIATDTDANAQCMGDSPRCRWDNDLFLDGKRLKHIDSLSSVGPGKWFFDTGTNNIYMGDNPAGHTVEIGVTPFAFPKSSASNVTIKNLVIEQYANPSQVGAIQGGDGWVTENDEVRSNHGSGIRFGSYSKVLRNYAHHNGQFGITGSGSDILVDGNEVSFNNDVGYLYYWAAGGTKFFWTTNLTVRNNYVHDNRGPGLWTDYNNYYTLYESNRTARNEDNGIVHELSFDATIRYNIVEDDAKSEFGTGLWHGAGIAGGGHSRRVTVYNNTVMNSANGISGAIDSRTGTSPSTGEAFGLSDYNVHDNVIVQSSGVAAGIISAGDTSVYSSDNNHFTHNIYKLSNLSAQLYQWSGGMLTKDQWKAAGNDSNGTWISPTDSSFPSTKFAENDRVTTTASTEVRTLPSTSDGSLLGAEASGSLGTITVIRGPIYSGGQWWWQVAYDNGMTGWSLESNLQKTF